eukprot:GHVH01002549.1.p1 GENE.GHVH01002549.1~~GHVH01002549.1.p1  ORF type:complete len:983 (+),score=97.83 GHVH01002549.1:35-2983(+)
MIDNKIYMECLKRQEREAAHLRVFMLHQRKLLSYKPCDAYLPASFASLERIEAAPDESSISTNHLDPFTAMSVPYVLSGLIRHLQGTVRITKNGSVVNQNARRLLSYLTPQQGLSKGARILFAKLLHFKWSPSSRWRSVKDLLPTWDNHLLYEPDRIDSTVESAIEELRLANLVTVTLESDTKSLLDVLNLDIKHIIIKKQVDLVLFDLLWKLSVDELKVIVSEVIASLKNATRKSQLSACNRIFDKEEFPEVKDRGKKQLVIEYLYYWIFNGLVHGVDITSNESNHGVDITSNDSFDEKSIELAFDPTRAKKRKLKQPPESAPGAGKKRKIKGIPKSSGLYQWISTDKRKGRLSGTHEPQLEEVESYFIKKLDSSECKKAVLKTSIMKDKNVNRCILASSRYSLVMILAVERLHLIEPSGFVSVVPHWKISCDTSRNITSYLESCDYSLQDLPLGRGSYSDYGSLTLSVSSKTGPIDINWTLGQVVYPSIDRQVMAPFDVPLADDDIDRIQKGMLLRSWATLMNEKWTPTEQNRDQLSYSISCLGVFAANALYNCLDLSILPIRGYSCLWDYFLCPSLKNVVNNFSKDGPWAISGLSVALHRQSNGLRLCTSENTYPFCDIIKASNQDVKLCRGILRKVAPLPIMFTVESFSHREPTRNWCTGHTRRRLTIAYQLLRVIQLSSDVADRSGHSEVAFVILKVALIAIVITRYQCALFKCFAVRTEEISAFSDWADYGLSGHHLFQVHESLCKLEALIGNKITAAFLSHLGIADFKLWAASSLKLHTTILEALPPLVISSVCHGVPAGILRASVERTRIDWTVMIASLKAMYIDFRLSKDTHRRSKESMAAIAEHVSLSLNLLIPSCDFNVESITNDPIFFQLECEDRRKKTTKSLARRQAALLFGEREPISTEVHSDKPFEEFFWDAVVSFGSLGYIPCCNHLLSWLNDGELKSFILGDETVSYCKWSVDAIRTQSKETDYL